MKRWFRRTLRRYGIDLVFTDVVCPEHVKAIRVGADGRRDVTVERALVFLALPEPGDLRDVVPISDDGETLIHGSPDTRELARAAKRNATLVYWAPIEPIVPYALYVHQYGWSSPGTRDDAALYTEFSCETRTGIARVEISTPDTFEAAVAFKRPRWRKMSSERSLMKYALSQLEAGGERPELVEGGVRLEWKLIAPAVGQRYLCVAFHRGGIALWQKRLAAGSLAARIRGLIRPLASA